MNRWMDPTEFLTTDEEYFLYRLAKDDEEQRRHDEWMEAQYQRDMQAEWEAYEQSRGRGT